MVDAQMGSGVLTVGVYPVTGGAMALMSVETGVMNCIAPRVSHFDLFFCSLSTECNSSESCK